MSAAFFDMDRTLVRVNTANLYVKWRLARGETSLREAARVIGWVAQYTFGLIDAAKVTRQAVRALRGIDEETFRAECAQWFAETVRQHVTDAARREVDARRRRGDACVILTATTEYASQPLADELDIQHVLCTHLEVEDGAFTGRCVDPVCYGPGKVEIAERFADEHGLDLARSAFYTDSVSDLPMLKRVGEPRIINPDPRLRVAARLRGWPIEHWT